MEPVQLSLVFIDDDPAEAELLRRRLEAIRGWEVSLAAFTEPDEGLAAVAQRRPDAVIMDYLLGHRTGLEVLREMQRLGHQAPVVIMTGRGDEQVAAEAMRLGAADYLPKSAVSPASLKRALGNAVERHRLRQAVEQHRLWLERTNQDLVRMNEQLQGFAHVLSHELKTPLTSLQEFLALVLEGAAGPLTAEQESYLSLARESCDQMALSVNDLLEMARLETGKLVIQPRAMEAGELVARAVAFLSPAAARRGIRVRTCLASEQLIAQVDDKRMVQVLTNLLNNALRFGPRGSEVVVAALKSDRAPGFLLFSVSDSGPGIPPEQAERVFERFHRADPTDPTNEYGLGLGLHVSREIVRLHGGDIWLEAEPGNAGCGGRPRPRGAVFCFTVPAADRSADDNPLTAGLASLRSEAL